MRPILPVPTIPAIFAYRSNPTRPLSEKLSSRTLLYARCLFLFSVRRRATVCHGLSPSSRFLQALNRTPPSSPSHSIIGQTDDVAPLNSAHLGSALSEILVPAGHGGFAHSSAIEEMKRILMPASDGKSFPASDPLRPDAIEKGFP